MTIKARKPHFDEPFSYEYGTAHHIGNVLIFIGNINGAPSWARIGSSFTRLDVLGVTSGRYTQGTVGRGFRPGDAFLHYSTGEGLVIARGRNESGHRVAQMRELKTTERTMLARAIKTAERELRWRLNSYCEDARRVAMR